MDFALAPDSRFLLEFLTALTSLHDRLYKLINPLVPKLILALTFITTIETSLRKGL